MFKKVTASLMLLLLAPGLALGAQGDFFPSNQSNLRTSGITVSSHGQGTKGSVQFNLFRDNSFLSALRGQGYQVGSFSDERDFVTARKLSGTKHAHSLSNLQVGDTIRVSTYVHNAAQQVCGGGNTARNTNVKLDWSNPNRIVSSVSASNANPGTINDVIDVSFAGSNYEFDYANVASVSKFVDGDYLCTGGNQNITTSNTSPSVSGDAATVNLGNIHGSFGNWRAVHVDLVVVAPSVPLNPNIDIDKDDSTPGTPDTDGDDTQTIQPGTTANFTIKVTNNGEVDLRNVRISDPEAPNCVRTDAQTQPLIRAVGNRDNIFNVDESFTYTCTDTNVNAAYTNLAQVTGTPVDGQPDVVDSDTTEVLLMLVPRIDIDKDDSTPGTVDTDGDDFQQVFSGNTATFTVKVTNTGPVSLKDVVVSDPLTSSCARSAAQTRQLYAGTTFDPRESFTYQCTRDNVTEGFTNVADVSGISVEDGTQVVDEDPTVVEVPPLSPRIDIDKDDSTPGTADSDGDDTQTVNVGGVATFTIKVTNVGNENLRNIVITDPNNSACDRTASQTAALIRAVGNRDNILNAGPNGGESFTYTCTDASVSGPYINTANVVGIGVTRGDVVTDNDPTTVNVPGGENPSINIDKDDSTPGTADADGNDTQTVDRGSAATFTIKVTNDGNVGLERVTTGDPLASNCALSVVEALPRIQAIGNRDSVFDPNESFTYTCTDPNVTADYTNTANVLGFSIFSGSKVQDSDPTVVVVRDPNGPACTASSFDTNTVRPGGNVTYSWTVNNVPANAKLMCSGAGVSINEDIGTRTSRSINVPSTATNGQVITCKIAMPNGTELCSDTVTVSTSAGNDPSIQIDKNDQDNSDDTQQISPNTTALFTITVTNNGPIALRNVIITDPRAANCERDAAFTAGQYAGGASADFDPSESFTYTCSQGSWTETSNTALVVGTPVNGDPVVTDEDATAITFPGGGSSCTNCGGAPSAPSIGVCTVGLNGAPQCQGHRPFEDPSDPAWRDYYACTQDSSRTDKECVVEVWAPGKGISGKLCGAQIGGITDVFAYDRLGQGEINNACNPIIPPIIGSCNPPTMVCPECFKNSENIAINKKVVGAGMVAKGGKVKYQIDLHGLETENNKFRVNSLEVRVHDRIIPAESGWIWGRGNDSVVDGDNDATWVWNDDKEFFTQTFDRNSSVVRALNGSGQLNDAARRDLQVHYDLDTDLAIAADEAKLTNVAFAMLIYTYDVRVPDGDGGYTWITSSFPRTMGIGNTCDVVGIDPNNFHNVLAQDSTLGSQAAIRIIRPFVEARGGNIAVSGGHKVTGETQNIDGANGHQTIVETGDGDMFDGFDFSTDTVTDLKDNFQSDREAYFQNLAANMVTGNAPRGVDVEGGTVMTHNYESGIYLITGGDVVIKDKVKLDRATTFVLQGANLIVESDAHYSDHFGAFVLRADENGNIGNIYIDKDVDQMDGVYIVEANANREQGRIMALGSQISDKQLTVNGNLIGDLSHLLAFRKYIGNTAGRPEASLIVAFDLRILESTPPILEQFLGQNWREEVSQ